MTPEITPSLTVPDAGRLPSPSCGAHTKKRKSSKADMNAPSPGAASVVDAFTVGTSGRTRAGREVQLDNPSDANRADRLQVGELTLRKVQ